jgi:uncharacterized protein YprB with RNaseH-like and TPR domain
MQGGLADSQWYGQEFRLLRDEEFRNEQGCCRMVELQTERVQFRFPGRETLESDFKLLYGVGDALASKLYAEGYQSLHDLTMHSRWGRAARDLLHQIDQGNVERLAAYGASDLQLLSFFQPERVLFIDIETTGLYNINPAFLVGVLQFWNGGGRIRQFLARDYSEEKAILQAASTHLGQAALIASYNGKSFDLPYLKGRMRFHQLTGTDAMFHIDLLRSTRRSYKHTLPNCRLLTIEKFLLATERLDDLPGSMVADYYHRFVETGDQACIQAILKHNAIDLLSMAKLLGVLVANHDKS